MQQPQQSAVFGTRKEPHTVIIARGDSIRHFTVRPWGVALAGAALACLVTGYLLATTYLVLRDDLIGASVARQARVQQAYEDRISALRAQLDRVTSRQILDQQFMQEKVGELIARQDALTERRSRLGPILDRHGGESAESGKPLPTPRPDVKADASSEIDRTATGSTIASAFAPVPADTVRWPLREGVSGEVASLSQADRTDRLFVQLNKALASIEAEQMNNVKTLAEDAYRTASAIADALEETGIAIDENYGEQDIGGPLLVAADPGSDMFEDQVRELDDALSKLNTVKRKAGALPLANPAPGARVSSTFGTRRDPFLGRPAHHTGVDFRAQRGTAVHATGAGTVIKAGWNGGYGRMVEIDHGDGLTSRYAHMSRILVREGQAVSAGTVVGKVGSTGRSTGPHLHYEVRNSGTAVNPSRFLSAGRRIAGYMKASR
ncbi:M23 family metallopeptidase [Nitratireductor sp. ZSWI3]|uniref:M23 family metallopeptidase n=1 Tax=Nitratireductor sp. ZSWI3 TaxID=2966359 RepID=UPI00214F76D4|nr:M23 family metallopeptidase [Nitratireductor sp. ZSWI3]MCR4266489.1 M23 family metallopeptidase [Nitratireductor sp. ZSWI3]